MCICKIYLPMQVELQFPASSFMFCTFMTPDHCLFPRHVFSAARGMDTVSPVDGKVHTSFIRSKMMDCVCLKPHASEKS